MQHLHLVVAIDLGAGGQHDLRLPAAVARRAQQPLAAGDVGGQHLGGLGDHAIDAHDRGQVIDAIGPADSMVEAVPSEHVGVLEAEVGVVLVPLHVAVIAGGKIVDHLDLVAHREVEIHEVGSDEAGAAGNEHVHDTTFLR